MATSRGQRSESVMGFHDRGNLRMAEGIQVKLDTSMCNDVYINWIDYVVKRSKIMSGKMRYSRTAEGIKIKLGTNMYNHIIMWAEAYLLTLRH